MEYRVVIEAWDDDRLWHRVEVREDAEDCLPGRKLGIAIGGAVAGMCVWDAPTPFEVVGYTLDAIEFPKECEPFSALGHAATAWWQTDVKGEFVDLCKVVVRRGFVKPPIWVTEVSDEVWNSLMKQPEDGVDNGQRLR